VVLLPPLQVALTDRDCKVFAGMLAPVFSACASMPTILICDVSLHARLLLDRLHVSVLFFRLGAAPAPECIHHTCSSSLTTVGHLARHPPPLDSIFQSYHSRCKSRSWRAFGNCDIVAKCRQLARASHWHACMYHIISATPCCSCGGLPVRAAEWTAVALCTLCHHNLNC
jgi:hypothetical protein